MPELNEHQGLSTTAINLRYIVNERGEKSFPWEALLLIGFAVAFFGTLLLLGLLYQEKEIICYHQVESDDNLRKLALEYYEDPGAWRRIFAANRAVLLHQKQLVIGQKLKIPLTKKELARVKKKLSDSP